MNDLTKNVLVFIVIIVVLLSVVQGLSTVNTGQPQPVDYSDFLSRVRQALGLLPNIIQPSWKPMTGWAPNIPKINA